MTLLTNHQIRLASRPDGEASAANFEHTTQALDTDALGAGEVLVRHHFLSLDPYMRGRMDAGKSYAEPQPLGEVMIGGTVGEVLASRNPRYPVGSQVAGMGGWQEYQWLSAEAAAQRGVLRVVSDAQIPLSAYLGPVGMPGATAWYGLTQIIGPQAGETVVVSAASGAVGSVVGQLAKARGCRAVGIAGGADKCRYVVEELGFDACIDHRQHSGLAALSAAVRQACPQGVDGLFENVGGTLLDAVMAHTNAHARIAVCGMIAGYDGQPLAMAQPQLILVNRLRIQGFIVGEHLSFWSQALIELGGLVAAGQLKYRESVAEGLAAAPEAFLGLLKGRNFGKQLVRLA